MSTFAVREIVSQSPEETRRVAASLASELPDSAVLALRGELGSGKTCFVQGLADGLGVREPVVSPSFAMVSEYHGARSLVHVDLYRAGTAADITSLGLDEYLSEGGVMAIEWAERAEWIVPPDAITVQLQILPDPGSRRIVIAVPAGGGSRA